MQITIDTNNLSELDINMLAFLADQGEETAPEPEPEVAPKKVTAATKKAAAAEPPAAEEEDLVGGEGPTMSDAVAAATELVSQGEAAKVKAALEEVGAKRVSEMELEQIPAFLTALES